MSPRRRRSVRTTVSTMVVLAAVIVGGYLVHDTGLLGDLSSAGADPTASAAAPTSAGAGPTSAGPGPTSAGPGAGPASADEIVAATRTLGTLPVKGKAPGTGYDRKVDFGTAWRDVDHNGCDTRNDVLARDLTDTVRRGPCTVVSGSLVSPYTGGRIAFVRGETTSTAVQIDHVVALENAWRTGAQQLTQDQREALANDPLNLFAVDQHSNEQKRSGDAATWLPASTAFRCTYVSHQVEVKAKYGLWVAPAEHDAIARILAAC